MAINTLEFVPLLQKTLDQQIIEGSTTGWMEPNADQIMYNGGKEVKIATMTTSGLGDYDRDNGHARGAVGLSYNSYTMGMDRGRYFLLDAMDVNETNFIANATSVMGTFQREHVIPEIDSYRYAKIAALAKTAGQLTAGYTPSDTDVLAKLKADVRKISSLIGTQTQLVISMSSEAAGALEDSKEFSRSISLTDFKRGAINTRVNAINDNPIVPVPEARMKTVFQFLDGKTPGQEVGGVKVTAESKDINWIIMPLRTPIAISKTDTPRIFSPEVYQGAHAWRVDYRKYHDLWILNSKLPTIMVNTK